jgi:hypothetical protein
MIISFIFLVLFLISCSDPVSSRDLAAEEIYFSGEITPTWGDFYEANVKLSPHNDNYDYVLLNKADSFYVKTDSVLKKLSLNGSSYSTEFFYHPGQTVNIILYLGETQQTLNSSIILPDDIHSTSLDINIEGQAKYHWIAEGADKFSVNWFIRCSSDETSDTQSFNQTLNESIQIAQWDLDSFLSQGKWDSGVSCNLNAKSTRSIYGDVDFNYSGGDLIASQKDERTYSFSL